MHCDFRTGFVIPFLILCLIITPQPLFLLRFRQLLVLVHVQQPEKIILGACYSEVLFLLCSRTSITCTVLFQLPFQHWCYRCSQKLFPESFHEWYWTKTGINWSQKIINISHIWQNRTKPTVAEITALLWRSSQSHLTASDLLLLLCATESLTLLNMRWESKLLYVWKSFFYFYLLPWFWK